MSAHGWTGFLGERRLEPAEAARMLERSAQGGSVGVVVFDDATGRMIDLDPRWAPAEIVTRLDAAASPADADAPATPRQRGPGRPKLGVVAREVTLLPRHWDWLAQQPGGASVALRRLVEEARRASSGADRARRAQEAAYRFMQAMAGDRPGYEDALRALYAGDGAGFRDHLRSWPRDIRDHAQRLATAALA